MGFFNRFLPKEKINQTAFKMITERGNGFYGWNGNLYQSDIVKSCIRPYVKALGKLTAKHIRENAEGFKINPEPYMLRLLTRPNPLMSFQMLIEKTASQLAINNNAFVLILRDDFGTPVGLYPVTASSVEAIYKDTELLLKFTFQNGKISIFPYTEIIHIRNDYESNDLFGSQNKEAITQLMKIVSTADQGIIKAIKNGAVIQWLLKYATALKPEKLIDNAKTFAQNYLSIESGNIGVAAVDATADIQRVEPKDYVPNASQMDRTTQRIYSFFNTNEKIIKSQATEDEWNMYFELVIEPVAIQLSNEFTHKLFSAREIGVGNRIYFDASNLQTASFSTKLSLSQMVDRGALTPNEWRAVFNLSPIQGGDEPVRRLDTAVVDDGAKGGDEDEN